MLDRWHGSADGNLTSDGSVSYGYDVENRLTGASVDSATLAYDPLGRLAQVASTGTGTTRFLHDGDALVAEYDDTGTLLRRYVHGPNVDEPLIWYEGSNLAARRHLRTRTMFKLIVSRLLMGCYVHHF